ncbi:MAG: glycogen/starch/alpha-glucan family phosphorylase, partial [Lachnospiraceae bacterium]|nr:glycogen/starch/alpha-glucan family phosphorylase [Lachnospiraceae bacterium]
IFKKYEEKYGSEYDKMPERIAIHINDTHPTMCIPELIHILIDEKGLSWDEAYNICVNTICYTNHTVLPEALEKWPIDMMKTILPRVYMIIEEINRRYIESFNKENQDKKDILANTAPLWDGMVRMANLSCICSKSINGVASLHTDILKSITLKDFYRLYPEKFNNKTNGVSHRRFLIESNPSLVALLNDKIGTDWPQDASRLEDFLRYQDDQDTLDRLYNAKLDAKRKLIKYIKNKNDIDINENFIFDIQIKRMHAYKRQLLNVFKILNVYNELRQGKRPNQKPTVYVFAGKAANSYTFAKSVIRLINKTADIINNDKAVNDVLKVVFIENFCVSNGQIMYPACDISEQISTAGKEASGTGNMKFMMNGAITLGTMDGANVEINHLVGNDNMMIFGMSSDEAEKLRHEYYDPNDITRNDSRLSLIKEQLVNGFLTMGSDKFDFYEIHDSLFKYGEEYFVIKDFVH